MKDCFLGLQHRSSLLECSDYIDIFSNFALLQQGKQTFIKLIGFYRVSFVEGV